MKYNKILGILACGAIALTSCQDDILEGGGIPAQVGDAIVFGGSMNFEDANEGKTRTVYGDRINQGNENDATEIKWIEGDGVRIYCEQAYGAKFCDYRISGGFSGTGTITGNGNDNNYETCALIKLDESAEDLQWGTTGNHNFYGVYPSPAHLKNAGDDIAANALKLENNKLTGYLPNTQAPTRYLAPTKIATKDVNGNDIEGSHYTIHPAMRNAYMVATKATNPTGSVTLQFKPIVTALEITLVNNSTHEGQLGNEGINLENVSLINITSSTAPLCGYFETDIDNLENTNLNSDASYKTIGIPVKGTDGNPITLKYGDKITVTGFMVLPDDLNSISISIVAGGTTKVATIKGNNGISVLETKKKNFIANIPISWNSSDKVSISNWVASIPDQTADNKPNYVVGLSIPGAGGAASKLLTTEYDKQQTLSIKELWNRGIRCFEFMCDKGSSLGNQKVVCGTTPVSITLQQAVDSVANLIKANPKEFAVVILGYQDVNVDSYDRNAGDNGWGGQFHDWWKDYSFSGESTVVPGITHAKSILTSTTTIKEARGKLFCIIRPMGIGIDGGWYTGIADNSKYNASKTPYVSALGWGTHPDQWYARGFGKLVTVNGTNFTAHAGGVANRPYVVNPTNLEDETYEIPTTKSFAYKFETKSDLPYASATEVCWVQDWRRVAPDENIRKMYGLKASVETDPLTGFHNLSGESWKYKWHPSVDEKWVDIINTLNMSMNDKNGNYKLYINSLCGYFIDGNIPLSIQPRPTFQRYTSSNYYYLDDKYNTSPYVGKDNLVGDGNKPEIGRKSWFGNYYSWGPYQVKGGNEGNIAAYADWVNNKFYNLLLTKLSDGTMNGPTGIVMMDRVSATADNPAGYYIPQIIIANNFRTAPATVSEIKKTEDPFNSSTETPLAKPRNSEGGMTITWE